MAGVRVVPSAKELVHVRNALAQKILPAVLSIVPPVIPSGFYKLYMTLLFTRLPP